MATRVNRRFIREKEARKLLSEFCKIINLTVSQLPALKPPLELADTKEGEIFFVDNNPVLVRSGVDIFPTLKFQTVLSQMPKAVVNSGAVPHICNGADVMAPGIVQFEGVFSKGNMVVVIDENHRKPIAIVVALYDIKTAETLKRGKILKNIHYVGDKLWKAIKMVN